TSPRPRTWAPSAEPANERPSSSTSAANSGPASAFKDHHRVQPFDLLEADLDQLRLGGRHVLAYVVGTYGYLAMAPVDEHRQLDGARAPKHQQGLDRRPRGPAVVDHVVDQHDGEISDVRHVG